MRSRWLQLVLALVQVMKQGDRLQIENYVKPNFTAMFCNRMRLSELRIFFYIQRERPRSHDVSQRLKRNLCKK